MSKYLNLECFFLFFAVIWKPFQYFILGIDGAARSLSLLIVITFLYFLQRDRFKRLITSKPLIYWLLWLIYAFTDTLILGYQDPEAGPVVFFFSLFCPLLVMYIICYFFAQERRKMFNTIIFAGYIHMLIIMAMASSTEAGRFGVELDENYVALTAMILLFFMLLANRYKDLSTLKFCLLSVPPLMLIVLTGSRTAFGCCCILAAGAIYSKRTKSTLLNLISIITFAFVLYGVYNYVLDNTYLGERLSSTTSQLEGSDFQTGTKLDKLGDRGFFYFWGYRVFLENPIFGIGLKNFRYNNELGLVQHSEYMTHLAELGIIGMILFLMFYLWILKNLFRVWKNRPSNRRITELYLTGFFSILFLNAWYFSYFIPMFFCYFGAAIGYIRYNQKLNGQR